MKHKIIFWIVLATLPLNAQTISEKRQSMLGGNIAEEGRELPVELKRVNRQLKTRQAELAELHAMANHLYDEEADEKEFGEIAKQIALVKREIAQLEELWRTTCLTASGDDPYALWHQPWSSIEQLVMDYGAPDYVYVIPPEVGMTRVSVTSQVPVPRESWNQMLESILTNNGIGIRQINAFARQLYFVSTKPDGVAYVTNDRMELAALPETARVCFVLSPSLADLQDAYNFIERFATPADTMLNRIGRQIFVLSSASRLQELLKIYDFAEVGSNERNYQLVHLTKTCGEEMAQIVQAYFQECDKCGLRVLAPERQHHSLFLSGPAEIVAQARELIDNVEAEIVDINEMTVFTYKSQHSDVEELAQVLRQVYPLMNSTRDLNNFVVSEKSGTIVMVVEQDLLPRLQQLLRKIDVPKRMVRIDVLLFEKRITDQSRIGLDHLSIGSAAKNKSQAGFTFGADSREHQPGLVNFMVSAAKQPIIPAFDFVYNFLMGREDIRINANPSVTAVNNTKAKIELVEEISIDNGTVIDPNSNKTVIGRSFTRTKYGITIEITPTIHPNEDGLDYITLDTSVAFDTPRPSTDNRPPVIQRRINNEVRIPDGQTVVLGGLRSKMVEDIDSGLPFLSEIPFFGKLFGSTKGTDRDTEMFIFITPKIIDDPSTELHALQAELLARRPGDIPEFLEKLNEAQRNQETRLFERSLKTLLGSTR